MYSLVAIGLNIVIGYAGLLDLGYVGFFAVGAFTVGVATSAHGTVSLLLAFPLAMAVTLGCASTSRSEGTGEYVDDTVITAKVKTAILGESTLKSTEINVETFKGIVQLSGFVNSQSDVNKAVVVAQNVKGVKSVKNDMRVK